MNVKINGKLENIPDNSTVSQILKSKNVRQEMVAVEINGNIVDRDNYESIHLKPGDVVEYLYYMGGGDIKKIIFRIEHDSLGKLKVPADAYWGINTQRAIENFPISKVRPHPLFIEAVVRIKRAAAKVNKNLGVLKKEKADAIITACNEIVEGKFLDHIVVDAFNSGAGTSFHMNVNEVIANRAIEIIGGKKGEYKIIHPNDDVNMSQSSNDVIPSAIKIVATIDLQNLYKSLDILSKELATKAKQFDGILKSGRTHMQDAVPIRLGQEFNAYNTTIKKATIIIKRSEESLYELNLGATAVGTGLNAHPKYKDEIAKELSKDISFPFKPAKDLIEATHNIDNFLNVAGALKALAVNLIQIANDLRLLSSGPRTGFCEIELPEVQAGSSIMPGKVNPVIPEMVSMVCFQVIGAEQTIMMAVQAGQFEMSVMTPVIVHNLLFSIDILTNACKVFVEKCVKGIKVNKARCEDLAEQSLGNATALNPYIGYEKAAKVAKKAHRTGKTIREVAKEMKVLSDEKIDKILSLKSIT